MKEKLNLEGYFKLAYEGMTLTKEDLTLQEMSDGLCTQECSLFVSGYILGKGYPLSRLAKLKPALTFMTREEVTDNIKHLFDKE